MISSIDIIISASRGDPGSLTEAGRVVMWIDISIVVGNQPIGLSVRRLDADACDRAAASLAWFSYLAMTGDTSTEPATWQTFMQEVIFEHVKFTVPGETDELTATWWDEASRQAVVALVETN